MSSKSLTTEQVLTLLADTPSHIAALTADLTPTQLRAAPNPDEWSANNVLAHLRACADVWGNCIVTMIAEDTPTLRAVNPLTWGNGLGVQIYRYRSVSRPDQRQQTKWFLFACTLAIGLLILYFALQGLVPAFNQPDSVYQLAYATVTIFVFLSIPVALGIAILRYRLWDIDVLIRRTLVYGTLTVILTAVYVGLIIGLQALLQGLISQDNSVAIVISTLTIAALFQPVRRRIQRIIDRRFYRSKYDAAKIVAAFSATLRNEVDLDLLRERLETVVQETMQPAHISLWLRPPDQSGTHRTPWRAHPPVSSEEG